VIRLYFQLSEMIMCKWWEANSQNVFISAPTYESKSTYDVDVDFVESTTKLMS
jgi:hypothetical protein